MASFVEQATLAVRDQSTSQINRINSALKQLRATANSLKSIKVDVKGISKASADVRKLNADLNRLKSSTISMKVDRSGITAASRQLAALRASSARPINITTHRTPVGFAGAAVRGAARGGGIGMPFGVTPAFAAVTTAAYLAAKALGAVAEAAGARSRSKLGLQVAATPSQVAIVNAASKQPGQMPLNVTENLFRDTARSLLGDVGGETPEQRATAASNVTRTLLRDLLPVAYALAPAGTTMEQAAADLAQAAKAVNIASSDFTDAAGNVTAEGKRALRGVMLGKYIAPEVPFSQIRTLFANLKTSATSMSSEALARVIAESADQGVRAANEMYQAAESFSGTLDNKRLNNALAQANLLLDVKRNKKGNVISGTPVDEALMQENFPLWFKTHAEEFVKQQVKGAKSVQAGIAKRIAALKPGATQEEITAASEPSQAESNAVLRRLFPSMRATARNAMTRSMFGEKQWERQLAQGKAVMGQDLQKIFDQNLIAQFENVKTTLENVKGNLSEAASEGLGIPKLLKDVDEAIKNPRGKEAQSLVARGIDLAQYTNPLTVASKLLVEGGGLLVKGASGLAEFFGVKPKTEAEKAAAAVAEAKGQAEVKRITTDARRESLERGRADLLVKKARAQQELKDARTPAQRAIARANLTRINSQLGPLETTISSINAQLQRLDAQLGKTLPPFKKEPQRPFLAELEEKIKHDVYRVNRPRGRKGGPDEIPLPVADPRKRGFTTDPSATLDLGQKFGESASIKLGETMNTANSNFALTFGTLPQKVSEGGHAAGTSIVSEMQNGAPGIGNAIGASFAAIASKVRVGVDASNLKMPDGGPDKGGGGSKPD